MRKLGSAWLSDKPRGDSERRIAVLRSIVRISARASSEKMTRSAIPRSDLRSRRFGHFAEVVHRETKIGQNLFHRHAAALLQRGYARLNSGEVFRRDRLIVDRRHRQSAVEWREHGFEQAANGGQLVAGQPVDMGMDVLTLIGNVFGAV